MKNQTKQKRIKRVFTSADQVLHLWANQSQSDARCANVFFNGRSVYSYGYHYELGRIVEYKGQRVALINDSGYSVTTAKHIRWAFDATAHLISLGVGGITGDVKTDVIRGLDNLERSIANELSGHFRSRKFSSWSRDWLGWADKEDNSYHVKHQIAKYNTYCDALGFPKRKMILTPEFIQDWDAHTDFCIEREDARLAKFNTPEEIAKREAKQKAAIEKAARDAADALNKWQLGGPLVESVRALSPQLIRLNGDEVETSRGARVPIDHALRLMRLVDKKQCRQGERVGHFTVSQVNDETIQIGCHLISLANARAVLANAKPKLSIVKQEA